ncbi:uncharacterized protein BT62DRAFT_1014398 [Guyanagaster necrorhizus]|uniref:Uncharacterized protein n=1 Tax=Guyanagaster necrorhizus TaxID=856835 RepID=A0A9P7VEH6_9AGAR|nr:uncharacterized protein BT62DRAFT_1014398 [Guyanagaster necrorhizus MCA 3950]KAG7439088.1 hypothetical protein BT62DRAFT_1014398 [Guyanagaster necrorhizus MCA 3950]
MDVSVTSSCSTNLFAIHAGVRDNGPIARTTYPDTTLVGVGAQREERASNKVTRTSASSELLSPPPSENLGLLIFERLALTSSITGLEVYLAPNSGRLSRLRLHVPNCVDEVYHRYDNRHGSDIVCNILDDKTGVVSLHMSPRKSGTREVEDESFEINSRAYRLIISEGVNMYANRFVDGGAEGR